MKDDGRKKDDDKKKDSLCLVSLCEGLVLPVKLILSTA